MKALIPLLLLIPTVQATECIHADYETNINWMASTVDHTDEIRALSLILVDNKAETIRGVKLSSGNTTLDLINTKQLEFETEEEHMVRQLDYAVDVRDIKRLTSPVYAWIQYNTKSTQIELPVSFVSCVKQLKKTVDVPDNK